MKILLAADFSSGSQAAIHEVASRPWPEGSIFQVLSVAEPIYVWDDPQLTEVLEEATQRTEDLVRDAAERLQSSGLNATHLVLPGDPKTVILDHAGDFGADLIVIGSEEVTGLTRLLLGSVARAVVRHAHCSVEIVRPCRREAGQPMRVLLATDGSENSLLAARSIAERPWPIGTEFHILSKVELSLSPFRAAFELPIGDTAAMEKARAEAMKRSQDAILAAEQLLTNAGLKTSEAVSVLLSKPQDVILEEARNWGADLIVVGSHGHGLIGRFILGSVSEAVAMHAHCSVEIIRKLKARETEKAHEPARIGALLSHPSAT